MTIKKTYAIYLALFTIFTNSSTARSETVLVAVASNFTAVAEKLTTAFSQTNPYSVDLSSGSTGKLYAQIVRGAPYDIFLAADTDRPRKLVDEGFAAAENHFTYATGRLVLWVKSGEASENTMKSGTIPRIAIANPDLAPYGLAARQTLDHYGVSPALVMGENVAQAAAMSATGNMSYALLPLTVSQSGPLAQKGNTWTIPAHAHTPIKQDAVLLRRGEDNPAAIAFFTYLASNDARDIITASGYNP